MTVFTRIELLVSSSVHLQLDRKKVHDRNSAHAKLSVYHKNKITNSQGQMLLTARLCATTSINHVLLPCSKADHYNNWWLWFRQTAKDCWGSSLITCFFSMVEIQSEVKQGILSSYFRPDHTWTSRKQLWGSGRKYRSFYLGSLLYNISTDKFYIQSLHGSK